MVEVVLAGHIVVLVPEHGIVDLRIVDLYPADDLVVNILELVPVDTLFGIGSVGIVLSVAVGDCLNFAVELGVAHTEENHIVEQQSQCGYEHQKRGDYKELSADFLFGVALFGDVLAYKVGSRRNVLFNREAVGVIVGGIFKNLGRSDRRQRRDLREVLACKLRLRNSRNADSLVDKAIALEAVAEISERENLCLFAREQVFLLHRLKLFLGFALSLSLLERLVALLPVIFRNGVGSRALGGDDRLYKILFEGIAVLCAQCVGDNHNVGLVVGTCQTVERRVDDNRVHQGFGDGLERIAVFVKLFSQLVFAFGQNVGFFLFIYGNNFYKHDGHSFRAMKCR